MEASKKSLFEILMRRRGVFTFLVNRGVYKDLHSPVCQKQEVNRGLYSRFLLVKNSSPVVLKFKAKRESGPAFLENVFRTETV